MGQHLLQVLPLCFLYQSMLFVHEGVYGGVCGGMEDDLLAILHSLEVSFLA